MWISFVIVIERYQFLVRLVLSWFLEPCDELSTTKNKRIENARKFFINYTLMYTG